MKPLKNQLVLALMMWTIASPFALGQDNGQPEWLQKKIKEYDANPALSQDRKIYAASYQGTTHYFVSQRCCDIPSELYDQAGTLVCRPSGGFAGGDGKCNDFAADTKKMKLIWESGALQKNK
jgi:hypothetical protein